MKWRDGHDMARTAYYVLQDSDLRYGIIVWDGTSAGNTTKVLTSQKGAICIVDNHLSPWISLRDSTIHTVSNLVCRQPTTWKKPGHTSLQQKKCNRIRSLHLKHTWLRPIYFLINFRNKYSYNVSYHSTNGDLLDETERSFHVNSFRPWHPHPLSPILNKLACLFYSMM